MNIQEDVNKSFLGRGWSFPPAFDEQSAALRMVEEEQDIKESITLLLATTPGERIMNPKYGCNLHSRVFDVIDSNTFATIEDLVSDAIVSFEPRIDLQRVEVDDTHQLDGLLEIQIEYVVTSANTRTNMVYPFYFREGTDLPRD